MTQSQDPQPAEDCEEVGHHNADVAADPPGCRTKSVVERWHTLRSILFGMAQRFGFHYRDSAPIYWGDAALCSVVSSRARIYVLLQPEGDLRIVVRSGGRKTEAVCNIMDFDEADLGDLFEQGFVRLSNGETQNTA